MPGINQVTIVGRLGKDPEVKTFSNGGKIANFSVATSEEWKEKATGERKSRTEWHNIVIQGDGLVGVVERFLTKGSEVALIGKLQTRKWADKDGNDRYTTEIVVGMGGQLALIGGGKGGGSTGAAEPEPYDDGGDVPF
jgi:single-strand DNA-binding protein